MQDVALPHPDDWVFYAAQCATLPALPAPIWSFLSSVVLLYLQPTLLYALAERLAWPTTSEPTFPHAIHFSGYSAGSYTAIALEAEYRLLSNRLQQPLCPGCATLGALGRPVIYLLALLQPHFCAGDHQPAHGPSASSMCGKISSARGIRASKRSPLRFTLACQRQMRSSKSSTPAQGPASRPGSNAKRTTMPTCCRWHPALLAVKACLLSKLCAARCT